LRPGDALLLETLPSFVEQQRDSRDFYLVSRLDGSGPPTTSQAPLALAILAAMVGLSAFGLLPMLQAAVLAAAAMVLTRCCSVEAALRAVDGPLLLTIACSFALGNALELTGAATAIADALLSQAGRSPWLTLFVIYGVTMLLTELITNNAAAVTMFPIAMAAAAQAGASHLPFAMSVAVAASAGFASPLGYQTHLMVYGPGGYKALDFLRLGLPMDLLLWAITCALAPVIWPF
jgi:di/tricarboxylate transporter